MTEHVPITELTFGIELEVIMPDASNGEAGRDELARRMTEAGVETSHEAYNHRVRPYWKIVTDGSIGRQNAEIVSPILRGETGFEQVRGVCQAIEAHGCRVNRTTGFHVHVGARDRFDGQIGFFKELVRTYAKYEPILDQLVAASRRARNSQWCQPVTYDDRCERATTIDGLRSAYGGSRYRKLNLEAYAAHGTVEFRQHQGTTNAQKIENWVKLCLRLVSHAARNTEPVSRGGVFMPPPAPWLPPAPMFPVGAVNLAMATMITGDEIPRFIERNRGTLRDLVITYVLDRTPRRAGTAGRLNHDVHNRLAAELLGGPNDGWRNLWDYHRRGGQRTHLAWDVDHGYVRVVRRSTAPAAGLSDDERARREGLSAAFREERARLTSEWEARVVEAQREWEAARGPAVEVTRPPTDAAPTTLDGLMELIAATEPERTYFNERQMELSQ